MNNMLALVMKKKIANLLREKVKQGLDEEIAKDVKKEFFDVLDSIDKDAIIPMLLATLIDREVGEIYGQQ